MYCVKTAQVLMQCVRKGSAADCHDCERHEIMNHIREAADTAPAESTVASNPLLSDGLTAGAATPTSKHLRQGYGATAHGDSFHDEGRLSVLSSGDHKDIHSVFQVNTA